MPDASPMDPAEILQRIDEIELVYVANRKVLWLCQQLRTALADAIRVDWLLKTLVSYKAKDLTLCVEWWLPDGLGVKTLDREAIDVAMKAEEQVHG